MVYHLIHRCYYIFQCERRVSPGVIFILIISGIVVVAVGLVLGTMWQGIHLDKDTWEAPYCIVCPLLLFQFLPQFHIIYYIYFRFCSGSEKRLKQIK